MNRIPQSRPVELRRRAGRIVTLLGLGWIILACRLVQLQFYQQQELARQVDRQREVAQNVIPRPGDIYDSRGRLLATTIRTQSLFVAPIEITESWKTAQQIAQALSLDADELFARIGAHADKHFLWVKRRLSEAEAERVRALHLPTGSWGFREEFQRVYPQGQLAAHVLGLRDIDGVGRGGIEQSCDDVLKGVPGKRILLCDARGRVLQIVDDRDNPPRPGHDVTLTIDSYLQLFTERALDELFARSSPKSCCAIVMDPRTGDILAMASRPTFDPGRPELAEAAAWKNTTISDIYEPGSTIKPLIVAYGLDRQLIQFEDRFHAEWGRYRMGRRLLHDHHPYGELSLTDVLVKSSNIGMAKIGERLTNPHLYSAVSLFGFGRKTGIELPGELAGILRPASEWTNYSTGSIPMGHELAVTPLQLITAHAALANGGELIRPRLLRSTADEQSADLRRVVQRTVSTDVCHWLVRVPMTEIVQRGTGRRAQIPGYDVFGKTGTAQGLSPNGGYLHGQYISSFVCGAPSSTPRLLVLVVVNAAKGGGGEAFGGRMAAPVAADILKHSLEHLHVRPNGNADRWASSPNAERQ